MSKLGALLSYFFIYQGFGISSYIFSILILLSGLHIILEIKNRKLIKNWLWGFYLMIYGSVFFAFVDSSGNYSGVIGYEINNLLTDYIGLIGTSFLLFILAMLYMTVRLNLRLEHISRIYRMNWFYMQIAAIFKRKQKATNDEVEDSSNLESTIDKANKETDTEAKDEIINQEKVDNTIKEVPAEVKNPKIKNVFEIYYKYTCHHS